MVEVFRNGLRVQDDVIEVYQCGSPFNSGEDDVQSSLKSSWGILKTEQHPYEPVDRSATRLWSYRGPPDLPVSTIAIKRSEYCIVAE